MKILITGGSGMIGREISQQLLARQHEVVWLSREPRANSLNIPEYGWDPDKGNIDTTALTGVDTIINLAGATLNQRWTPTYKSEIIRSRVDSLRLLYDTIHEKGFPVKSLLSASAVGYYPHDYQKEYTENDAPGNDFISMVCQKWEQEAQNFENLNIRVVRCRIGIVLSEKGGALKELAKPIRYGLGAPLGNGRQWMAWIHLADVAGIFVFLAEHSHLTGIYNVVGPSNVTNSELTKAVARVLQKPQFLPKVPAALLKLVLGEMSRIVLISNKVSNKKISAAGYDYQFPELQPALQQLLK